MRPDTKMVWLETPCNPILRLTDLEVVIRRVRESSASKAEVVVDSTFATPLATRPLDYGADFVVHSLTKYIGGHGDAMGGGVIGRDPQKMQELAVEASVHYGATMSPFNAWLIMRGAATLPIRMQAHQQHAMQVAESLEVSL